MGLSLKEIWNHRMQILEGVKNTIFKKDHIEFIATERMKICQACPLIDLKGDKCLVPGTAPCCGECGCKLAFKTRSMSSECPHPEGSRWESIITEEEEEKLYTDINYNPDDISI
jgi:hypothetical protein